MKNNISEIIDGIDWEKAGKLLANRDSGKVVEVISKDNPSLSDLALLLSPGAEKHIAQIREKAAILKKNRFGKTIKLYAPLYVSSYCVNDCAYCGFKVGRIETRRHLTEEEIIKEAEAPNRSGIDSVLVVSGEDPDFVDVAYLETTIRILRKYFSYISLEVQAFDTKSYRRLFNAGAHGLVIYQETYRKDLFNSLHKGPKCDYEFRIGAPARAAEAGFYNLGIGVLLGLDDWRKEAIRLAAHAFYLKKKFWNCSIQFSFPRIRNENCEFRIPAPVSEKELEQMILAFRMTFQESDISVSTRESCEFRDKIVMSAANVMSAASKVVPGAYSEEKVEAGLGQFKLSDTRTIAEITKRMLEIDLDPVFKDWDTAFGKTLNPKREVRNPKQARKE